MYEKYFNVIIYSHFFKITNLTNQGRMIISQYCKRFTQYEFKRQRNGKVLWTPARIFAASTVNRSEFRFHINCLNDFKLYLKDNFITENIYTVENYPLHEASNIDINMSPDIILRDYQVPAVEYLVNEDTNFKLLEFSMGRGKGICTLATLSNIKKRTLFTIRPAYIEKWIAEIQAVLLELPTSIMVAQGSAQLKALIQLGLNKDLHVKYIIISNKTLQNFISSYESDKEYFKHEYWIDTPEDLFNILEVGIRVIDEVHLDCHFNFKTDLYTNVYKTISLSATLISNNEFLMRMFEINYPKKLRYNEAAKNPFREVYSVYYNVNDKIRINTKDYGSNNYSHHAFEKSILKNYRFLRGYLTLIDDLAKDGYFRDYIKGDKLIIFAISINLVTKITEFFKHKYPDLDVRRYVEDDPYENVIDADIRVTTIQSGGTAVDIPQLSCSIMSNAVSSIQSNLQTFGRLREIKGRAVRFFFLNCNNVKTHLKYAEEKKRMLINESKSFKEIYYPKTLG